MIAVMLATGAPRQALSAQPLQAQPIAATRSITPAAMRFVREGACEFVVDVTPSADTAALASTLAGAAHDLGLILDALKCKLLRVVPFAGDLFVSINEFPIPRPELAEACTPDRSNTQSMHAKAIEILYPRIDADHKQKVIDACARRQRAVADVAASERAAAIAKAAEQLRTTARLAPKGPCTALPQAVGRALVRSATVLVITDGWSSCTPPPNSAYSPGVETLAAQSCIVFLIIPTTESSRFDAANALLERIENLESVYRGSFALLAPEATPAFWHQFTCVPPASH